MSDRLLPTLFLVSCGFILCLLCAAVYLAIAAVDNRRAAKDAEALARAAELTPPLPDITREAGT